MSRYILPVDLRPHFFESNPDGGTPDYCICGKHESDRMHVGMLKPYQGDDERHPMTAARVQDAGK